MLASVPPEVWTALSHLIAALLGWIIPGPILKNPFRR